MEKLMTQNALKTFRFVRLALMVSVGFPLILASNAFAQLPAPAVPTEPGAPAPSSAEVERVVVTGSNIPTAEKTGPNPVDTYRPQDIEKLGIRSATDLQEFIPQQAGGTVNCAACLLRNEFLQIGGTADAQFLNVLRPIRVHRVRAGLFRCGNV